MTISTLLSQLTRAIHPSVLTHVHVQGWAGGSFNMASGVRGSAWPFLARFRGFANPCWVSVHAPSAKFEIPLACTRMPTLPSLSLSADVMHSVPCISGSSLSGKVCCVSPDLDYSPTRRFRLNRRGWSLTSRRAEAGAGLAVACTCMHAPLAGSLVVRQAYPNCRPCWPDVPTSALLPDRQPHLIHLTLLLATRTSCIILISPRVLEKVSLDET